MREAAAGPTSLRVARRLRGRDLITIGIFFALYVVITMVPMVMSGIHPLVWVLFPGLAAIVGSVPFMLLCTRVRKPLAVLIMGVLLALLSASTGNLVLALVLVVGSSALSEFVRWLTGYASYRGNATAFAFFSFGWMISPLPIWLYHDSFMAQILTQGMPDDYVRTCEQIADPSFLVLCAMFTLVGATVGSFVTHRLFKRHFVRAGLAEG